MVSDFILTCHRIQNELYCKYNKCTYICCYKVRKGERNVKRVAILGSSGGNLYNLGGKNPERLLRSEERRVGRETRFQLLENLHTRILGVTISVQKRN